MIIYSGRVLLAEDKARRKKAWRHLLSAAFGYPDHGPTNYWLGRFYEQEGRLTRVDQLDGGTLTIDYVRDGAQSGLPARVRTPSSPTTSPRASRTA